LFCWDKRHVHPVFLALHILLFQGCCCSITQKSKKTILTGKCSIQNGMFLVQLGQPELEDINLKLCEEKWMIIF